MWQTMEGLNLNKFATEPANKEIPFFIPHYLQGTRLLYVYMKLRLKGSYFHGPDEFIISEYTVKERFLLGRKAFAVNRHFYRDVVRHI